MTKLLLCLTLILGPTLSAAEQDISARTTANKCKSTPCGNTATGEDPQEQRIHEGLIRSDKIRNGDDDQLRWESIRLYSESSSSDKLAMPVIKAAGFEMQLEPKSGHLSFSKQGKKQVFSIASPVDDPSSICPRYVINVLEASIGHALVRMICLKSETAPGRQHMGVDYYLYDAETATMRSIWHAAVIAKDAHMPHAKPTPSLKIIPNGYRFDWSGVFPSDNGPSTMVLHNTYTRIVGKSGDKVLLCTDMSAPKGQGIEDEMCEGGIVPQVMTSSIK